MRRFFFGLVVMLISVASVGAQERAIPNVILGIHGGAGGAKSEVTPELEQKLRKGLDAALIAGYEALQKPGATSLDGVEAAIRVLEDDENFNAGRGAVFTHDGRNELDASVMLGSDKKAGSVASVTTIKNPISAARAVMEKSRHVMMIGSGAEKFATEVGLEIVDPAYFRTEARWQELQKQIERERLSPDKDKKGGAQLPPIGRSRELSTVGAVAIDKAGNLAAGTSTGGMSNKRHGRVGDSPIIGAGTYADNKSCAVSCTGHGEFFIRYAVSHDICMHMEYRGFTVQAAADAVIHGKLEKVGGEGAAIALDAKGNFAMSHNSEGLYRGYVTADGKRTVMLFEK